MEPWSTLLLDPKDVVLKEGPDSLPMLLQLLSGWIRPVHLRWIHGHLLHPLGLWIETTVGEERRDLRTLRGGGIVGMLCQRQQRCRIVLLEIGVVAQIAFEDLVNSFRLASCLGVKSGRLFQIHPQVLQ